MTRKSALAVLAGFVAVVVITSLVDAILHALRVFPPIGQPIDDAHATLALSYRLVIGVVGGWLTARLAAAEPMRHAMALGVIGTAAGLVGIVATWNLGLGPRWYSVAVAAFALPECWAGAWIFNRNTRRAVAR